MRESTICAPLLPGVSGGRAEVGGRLLERMLDFLVRLGDVAPAVVVVEDLHWADSSTRDLVAFLARNIHAARVLLMVTYRADDLHRRHPLKSLLAELERSDASWIRLAGLARRDIAELVANAAGRPRCGMCRFSLTGAVVTRSLSKNCWPLRHG